MKRNTKSVRRAAWVLVPPLVAGLIPVDRVGAEALEAASAAAVPVAASKAVGNALSERWGIEVLALRLAAHGHMLDFRYKVLDADKARAVFNEATKPRLIHEATGKVLAVPVTAKVGPLRSTYNPQAGRSYWMFFGNAGGLVKAGDRVTAAIGELRAEGLVVE
jgi:hypothetical protein